jgi:hypothetical protein
MAESTRFRFVSMDDEYYMTGKIPLRFFTSEAESDILLPGHGRCATSVTHYKSALARIATMAHDVHVKAKEQGSRVLSFLSVLGKNAELPEDLRDSVVDIEDALVSLLNACDIEKRVPVVSVPDP